MKNAVILLFFLFPALIFAQSMSPAKQAVVATIEAQKADMIQMSDAIWALAETALEETKSADILAEYARANGMEVEMGVAGMPTAFVASYGSGKPVIGILGEFDALPGLSQKAVPEKAPLEEGAAGHGCGHNMFGVGSLAAAVAVKELIADGQLQGTVRFYGTPAEEKYFGKLYFARDGLLDDLDVCLDWHPSAETKAELQSSKALVDYIVEFKGQAAHASLDPWNGRSAVDGLEFFTTGLNYLREHVRPQVRIHYHIMDGGDVVNVVPDYAKIWTRVRDSKTETMLEVYERTKEIAKGAALMANVDYEITLVSGLHEVIVNRTGGLALHQNLEILGPITYTAEETEFAYGIQEATGAKKTGIDGTLQPVEETLEHPMGASSDVGDVSWLVPEIRLGVTTAPIGTPWHSWAVVACGGMSIGHKGMVHAAKALSMTMVDLLSDPQLVKDIRTEFNERMEGKTYEPILPDGPPPVPGG